MFNFLSVVYFIKAVRFLRFKNTFNIAGTIRIINKYVLSNWKQHQFKRVFKIFIDKKIQSIFLVKFLGYTFSF